MNSERESTVAERRWLTRLQRVLDDQPASLLVYCHGDTATVLDRDNPASASEYDKREAILDVDCIRTRGWIAGDF